MIKPATSKTVFSHCGMPVAAEADVGAGDGRCWLPGGGEAGDGWGGLGVDTGDDATGREITSTMPGRIVFGSGPMSRLLAAYSAGQPPRTENRAAMPDNVSPATTV